MILMRSCFLVIFAVLGSLSAPLVLAMTDCELLDSTARLLQLPICGNTAVCDPCFDVELSYLSAFCTGTREFCANGLCGRIVTAGQYIDFGIDPSSYLYVPPRINYLYGFSFTTEGIDDVIVSCGTGECEVSINNQTCSYYSDVQCQDGTDGFQVDCSNLGAGVLDTCQLPGYGLTPGSSLAGLVIPDLDECNFLAGDTNLTNDGNTTTITNDNTTDLIGSGIDGLTVGNTSNLSGSSTDGLITGNTTDCALADSAARKIQSSSCGSQDVCGACFEQDSFSIVECESTREYCINGMCGRFVIGGKYNNNKGMFVLKYITTSGGTGNVTYSIDIEGQVCTVDINDQACSSCVIAQCNGATAFQMDCSNLGAGYLNECQKPDYNLTQGSILASFEIDPSDCSSIRNDTIESTGGDASKMTEGNASTINGTTGLTGTGVLADTTDSSDTVLNGGTNNSNNNTNPNDGTTSSPARQSSATTFTNIGHFNILSFGLALAALSVGL